MFGNANVSLKKEYLDKLVWIDASLLFEGFS